ncbi:MAG: aminopeptidase [Pseudomonadota bacterium]
MDYPVQQISALALTEGSNLSSTTHPLVIEAPGEASAMSDALEEEALRLSPRRILRVTNDPDTILTSLKDGRGVPPPSAQQWEAQVLLSATAARIRVVAPRPDMLEGLPVGDIVRWHGIIAAAKNEAAVTISGRAFVDMAIPYPTKAWATHVFPRLAPDDALDRLSQALARSFFLHAENPKDAWQRRRQFINRVVYFVRKRGLTRLAIKGQRTDLELALEPPGDWRGSFKYAFNGTGFNASFPVGGMTATIVPSGSHGKVHINRPLSLAGQRISGLDLKIRDGLVTIENAEEGGDVLAEFLRHAPGTRQLATVSLPVSGHFPTSRNEAFCNPMMDATTAHGLTLTDPATDGALRFDLFFDDDELTIEGTDADGTTQVLDKLLGSPEAPKARDWESVHLGEEDCRVSDLDEMLGNGLALIQNGAIAEGIASLVETERLAKDCFHRFKIVAHDWESKYQQMDRLKIAEAAREAIDAVQDGTPD